MIETALFVLLVLTVARLHATAAPEPPAPPGTPTPPWPDAATLRDSHPATWPMQLDWDD